MNAENALRTRLAQIVQRACEGAPDAHAGYWRAADALVEDFLATTPAPAPAPGDGDALDTDAISEKWLQPCGPCDAGIAASGCTHPDSDYRPVMLTLVEEVDRLRAALSGGGAAVETDRVDEIAAVAFGAPITDRDREKVRGVLSAYGVRCAPAASPGDAQ